MENIYFEVFSDRQRVKLCESIFYYFRLNTGMIAFLGCACSWVVIRVMWKILFDRGIVKKRIPYGFNRKVYFFLYILFMLQMMVFNRALQKERKVQLIPFQWLDDGILHESRVIEAVLNVVIFIPVGIMQKTLLHRGFICCTVQFFLLSLLLEFIQFITRRGTFSTEDILCAVMGGIVGIFFFYLKRKGKGLRL